MKWVSAISYPGWLPSGIWYLHGPGEGDADPVVGAGEGGWDDPRFGGIGQFPVRHPPQQLLEQDADLEPGQVRAQAQVGPRAESEVAVAWPGHVQRVRVGKGARVTVGRPVQQHDLVAGTDLLAVPVMGARRRAAHVQDRGHPADELLDRGRGEQPGALDQDLPLARLEGQLTDHRPDDRPRGLRAAVQDED